MGVILQVALPSRVLAAATRLQCGAAGADASEKTRLGKGVIMIEYYRTTRGESVCFVHRNFARIPPSHVPPLPFLTFSGRWPPRTHCGLW